MEGRPLARQMWELCGVFAVGRFPWSQRCRVHRAVVAERNAPGDAKVLLSSLPASGLGLIWELWLLVCLGHNVGKTLVTGSRVWPGDRAVTVL